MFSFKLPSFDYEKTKWSNEDWEKAGIKINFEHFLESNDKVIADMTFSKEDVLAKYHADESSDRDKWLKLLENSETFISKEIDEWIKRFRWTTWNKTYDWFLLKTRAGCTKSCVDVLKNIDDSIVLPFWCCSKSLDKYTEQSPSYSLSKNLIRESIIAVKADTELLSALCENLKFQDCTGEKLEFDLLQFYLKPIYNLKDFVATLAHIYGTLLFTHIMDRLI